MPKDEERCGPRRGPAARFDGVTIAVHWVTLLLVLFLFASAWARDLAEDGARAETLLAAHRSIGLLLWMLTLARLAWRFTGGVHPPLPDSASASQLWAARATEYALYILLAVQPLTGLAQSVLRGKPFGLLVGTMQAIAPRDRALVHLFHDLHEEAAWLLLALIGLHAAAALFHRLVLRDAVLQSILPWRARTNICAAGE
ncbi:MAG: cytochrome [Alphaproteobacteria bacterium]|nr:cytochrome [Alphaproteobacteria bacterium]